MDEDKLREDDWLNQISQSIGEQIDIDEEPSDSEIENDKDKGSMNKKEKKDETLEEELKGSASQKAEAPVVDEATVIENETVGEESSESSNLTGRNDEVYVEDDESEATEEPDALENYLEHAQDDVKRQKWSWKKKLLLGLCIFGLLVGGISLAAFFMLDRIDRERPEDIKKAATDLTPEELKAQQATLKPQEFNNKIEQKVVNILLIGEEAINDGVLGRSDSAMVATLNTVEKTIKLTSLMRDMYVTIPGYKNNKMNAAFHNGGGVLLAETVEQNFGIEIDGYVRVNFDAFEKIINKLGGVVIELTADEAHYLNTTNYISKVKYRNVKEGRQKLNGNQALGYCRVRYKTASNGEANDFGRTYRQRTVLKAIFDKYKHQNVVNMISIATDLLSDVKTSLTKPEIISYLTTAASFGSLDLETLRIPLDNSYEGQKIDGKAVLVVDFDKNKQALRDFIYAGIADSEIKVESGDTEDDRYFSYLWTD